MKTIKQIINASGDVKRWRETHEEMRRLERTIADVLQAHDIADNSCHVASLREEELRLCAVSAAAAVRIKQILPTLCRALNRNGYKVGEIRVIVLV